MRRVFSIIIVSVFTGVSILPGCKKEPEGEIQPVVEPPRGVITEPVTAITSYKAIAGGVVSSSGGTVQMISNVCWSTEPDPDTSCFNYSQSHWISDIKQANNKPGAFSTRLDELLPNTTYYIRAFAINEAGITYGNQLYFNTLPDISDYDGNDYGIANIGSQTWMTEDLHTTSYNNGEPITVVRNFTDWRNLTGPGYYIDTIIDDSYFGGFKIARGPLYNWNAVNTGKLCPVGWHVPTDAEWLLLPLYVGRDILCSCEYGDYQGTCADPYVFDTRNRLSIICDTTGAIIGGPDESLWWSSTPAGNYNAWYFILDPEMMRQKYSKKYGLNVRCVKD